jgi:transposase-like protein
MAKRRTFSSDFKSKIVLEALREEKPLGEIANEYDISPNQLRNWRDRRI